MKVEIIYSFHAHKHIEHISEEGREKIQFKSGRLDKLPDLLQYVNEYSTKNNCKIITVVGTINEAFFYLQRD